MDSFRLNVAQYLNWPFLFCIWCPRWLTIMVYCPPLSEVTVMCSWFPVTWSVHLQLVYRNSGFPSMHNLIHLNNEFWIQWCLSAVVFFHYCKSHYWQIVFVIFIPIELNKNVELTVKPMFAHLYSSYLENCWGCFWKTVNSFIFKFHGYFSFNPHNVRILFPF